MTYAKDANEIAREYSRREDDDLPKPTEFPHRRPSLGRLAIYENLSDGGPVTSFFQVSVKFEGHGFLIVTSEDGNIRRIVNPNNYAYVVFTETKDDGAEQ